MDITLLPLQQHELTQFKTDIQAAFQKGFEAYFGKTDDLILPERDIDQSLSAKGAAPYKAVRNGQMVGGAVVCIDESGYNHLDLLYVKDGVQDGGIGKAIWDQIEKLYPHTL